ncbi:hypothetical protein GCM10007904_33980 [Oharaeibacter diazotrophicus]|nr:hypothetical protein GCM10007904_33980 [Oharaeibacter diazotrophicus]
MQEEQRADGNDGGEHRRPRGTSRPAAGRVIEPIHATGSSYLARMWIERRPGADDIWSRACPDLSRADPRLDDGRRLG